MEINLTNYFEQLKSVLPNNRVLLCPLDWGLGHASRMIPIISILLKLKFEVIIAGSGRSLILLKREFPELGFVDFPFVEIRYAKGRWQFFYFLFRAPIFFLAIVKEHFLLKSIVRNNRIALIISDNRFGLWHKNIFSIYFTHQYMIKLPPFLRFLESFVHSVHRFFIQKYSMCFIPDFEGNENLGGDLSHKYPCASNTKYCGILSRFRKDDATIETQGFILVILSGPEPQRTFLENQLYNIAIQSDLKFTFVAGKTESEEQYFDHSIEYYSFLTSANLMEKIKSAEIVISRAGYSTICDLYAMNKKAILIPTPGQTEQEYLANHLFNHYFFRFVSQYNSHFEKRFWEAMQELKLKQLTV